MGVIEQYRTCELLVGRSNDQMAALAKDRDACSASNEDGADDCMENAIMGRTSENRFAVPVAVPVKLHDRKGKARAGDRKSYVHHLHVILTILCSQESIGI